MYRSSKDVVVGYAEAAGSTLIHKIPPLRGIGRAATKLTGPNDRFLRWRVADRSSAYIPDEYWAYMRGVGRGVRRFNLATWENGVFGVPKSDFETFSGGRPAVAHRLGTAVMIGVNEMNPPDEFLRPVNEYGVPDVDGNFIGVVMRGGENPLDVVIGSSTANGKQIVPLPTELLSRVVEVPDGLYRV